MTGANEAELMNELGIPFAMVGIIDNMANGIGDKLTVSRACHFSPPLSFRIDTDGILGCTA